MIEKGKPFTQWGSDSLELAKQLIADFEGFRSKAYKCQAGVLTIGYGHTKGVKEGMTISEDEAEKLLWGDLVRLRNDVAPLIRVGVTEGQFIALLSFAYNVGVGNLKKSTLLRLLNRGSYSHASEEFAKWIYVKGQPSKGLMNRRKREREYFDTEDG